MKSNLLWAALLFLAPYLSTAQPLVKLGKSYRVVDSEQKYYYQTNEGILTLKINADGIILSTVNPETMQQTKTFANIAPWGFTFENILELDNKYLLFYSAREKSTNEEQLQYQIIDLNTCKLDGNAKTVIKINKKITASPSASLKLGIQNKFDFYHSFDKSKILITYRLEPELKKDALSYDIIGLDVFDNALNKISFQEIKMPHTEKQMNNIDYAVDSDGNAFILSLVFEDESVNKNKKLNYTVELLKIKPNVHNINIIPMSLQGKFVNKLWLYETKKNNMVCAGYYSSEKNSDAANGIMLFNVSSDNKIYGMINHEIPLEVLNQFVNERNQKKNIRQEKKDKAEFEDLVLRNLIVQKDGSILLTGEQYYVEMGTYVTPNGMTRFYNTYFYNDILACKINADGSLAWMRKLPKRQMGNAQKGGLSYKYMSGDKEHYFIFLDNEKNMKLSLNDFPAGHVDGKGGFLTAYKVNDANGAVEKISILNTRDVQGIELYQFAVNRILPISTAEFVFEAYKKGKEDVMLKVQFQK